MGAADRAQACQNQLPNWWTEKMVTGDYKHPKSGRIYREGDPAHDFVLLLNALRLMAGNFIQEYEKRLRNKDYLEQVNRWQGDMDRIARAMTDTIDALNKAYTAVGVDQWKPDYGLGTRDGEWHRKYGEIEA